MSKEDSIKPYELFDFDEDGNIISNSSVTTDVYTTDNIWITTSSTSSVIFTGIDAGNGLAGGVGNTILFDDSCTVTYNDPYFELNEFHEQNEKEEQMREECPALQEAWEQYQFIKKLVEDEECDKYTEERLKTFKKK